MADAFRYAAFISYSSKDAAFAQKLHRALESYGIPSALGKFDLLEGAGKRNRIYPVFRDREELAAGDLSERIAASLKASRALIVVCSPNAAASPWVEKEIQSFVALGRRENIFAIIAEDAPAFDAEGREATPACFPPAFRGNALADAGALEPLAADARKGKDGFRKAWLKIVAGLIGVTPGQLIDRDRRRRMQQRLLLTGVAAVGVLAASIPIAWQDTTAWRSSLTAEARLLQRANQWPETLAMAVAGMDVGGAILPAKAKDADDLLKGLAGVSLRAVLPKETKVRLVAGGAMLTAIGADGSLLLYDLANPGPPRTLGVVEAGANIQGGGKTPVYVTNPKGGGWLLAPKPGAQVVKLAAPVNGRPVQLGGSVQSIWTVALDDQGVMHLYGPDGKSERTLALGEKATWFDTRGDAAGMLVQTASGKLYALRLGEAGEPRVLGTAPPLFSVSLSSGAQSYALSEDDELYRIDLEGKSPVQLLAKDVDPSFEMAWDDEAKDLLLRQSGGYASIDTGSLKLTPLVLPAGAKLDEAEAQFVKHKRAVVLSSKTDGGLWYFALGSDKPGVRFATAAGGEGGVSDQGLIATVAGKGGNANYPLAGGDWYSLAGDAPVKRGHIVDTAATSKNESILASTVNGVLTIASVDGSRPPVALGKVGLLFDLFFSPDGNFLLSWERNGALRRFEVATGKETRLGTTAAANEVFPDGYGFFRPSANGRWAVIEDSANAVWLVDSTSDAPARRVGKVDDFGSEFAEGTNIIKIPTQERDIYLDPVTGAEVAAPPKPGAQPVVPGSARVEQDDAGRVTVRPDGVPAADMGVFPHLGALSLSVDGQVFAGQEPGGALWIVDVHAPDKRRNLAAEYPSVKFQTTQEKKFDQRVFRLSRDGGAVIERANGGTDTLLVSLKRGASILVYGRDSNSATFSEDGRMLVFADSSKPTLVFDLDAPTAAAAGSALADRVCRQSGDALPPFALQLREATKADAKPRQAEDAAAYEALRGRPWNPCDWRGVLAILPDDSGGGWFEGPRQWLRLAGVKMGIAKDYSCEETVGGADASRREARKRACKAGLPAKP